MHGNLIAEAAPIVAAQKLLAHIREHYDNIPAFCDKHGFTRQKVERAIKHGMPRMDLKFAVALEKASGGAAPAPEWLTPVEDTAVEPQPESAPPSAAE